MARGWGRREETRLLTVRVFDVLGGGRGGVDAEDVVVRPRGIALTRHRHRGAARSESVFVSLV